VDSHRPLFVEQIYTSIQQLSGANYDPSILQEELTPAMIDMVFKNWPSSNGK
jgi:hypothetical protein